MHTDDPLFLAVLDNPDDLALRAIYADWLQERSDPRGDFLRLLLYLASLQKGDPKIKEILVQIRAMRPSLNRHWVAIVDEFDCRVRAVCTVNLRISTYGSAPKKYRGATKVGHVERAFLVRNGWEHAGDGRSYSYVRPPAGSQAKNPVIPVEVPTDAELERLGTWFHQKGEESMRIFGPWIVRYRRANSVRYSIRVMTGPEQDQPWQDVRGPAEFEFGIGAPWGVTLSWRPDSDTPSWSRSTSHVVS